MPKQRKIAIMGYRSVGKTTLTIQYVDGQFVDSYSPTIENSFTKVIKYRGQEFELRVVDTAGQDEYSIFPAIYSMDIHGYIFVYSITSVKSFEVLHSLYEKLLDVSGKITVPILLVGNKKDLQQERTVTTEDGKRLAESWNAAFVETSARSHDAVCEIFQQFLHQIEGGNLSSVPDKQGCVIA